MAAAGPQVAVGAIVVKGDSVLLVRRGTPPNEGTWAIPGGRLRLGETLAAGAERETLEETGVRIRAGEVIYTVDFIERDAADDVRFHYLIVDLAGEYIEGEPRAGDDAAEARWVALAELAQIGLNPSSATALHKLFPRQFPGEGA